MFVLFSCYSCNCISLVISSLNANQKQKPNNVTVQLPTESTNTIERTYSHIGDDDDDAIIT